MHRPDPFAFLRVVEPQRWGAEIFSLGLWIALPLVAMLLFTNLVLGVIVPPLIVTMASAPGAVAAVPEPETYLLMVAGLAAVAGVAQRRRQRRDERVKAAA